jgi:uncharacterized membrane protein
MLCGVAVCLDSLALWNLPKNGHFSYERWGSVRLFIWSVCKEEVFLPTRDRIVVAIHSGEQIVAANTQQWVYRNWENRKNVFYCRIIIIIIIIIIGAWGGVVVKALGY